jgi:hypothetical protein
MAEIEDFPWWPERGMMTVATRMGLHRSNRGHQEDEDIEAHPPVPSEKRGVDGDGGAMVVL